VKYTPNETQNEDTEHHHHPHPKISRIVFVIFNPFFLHPWLKETINLFLIITD
jgi:hypothetical protein